MSRVHSSVLGFYTQHIVTCLFKVQCTIGCDVPRVGIEIEEEAGTCRGIEEGVGDLCINALILVCCHHPQHKGSPGHVFLEVDSVYILAEPGSIIVGVGDLDSDLGGATQRRGPAICGGQD
uniref:Uncharacterized protein n=1 Tax=Prolemur simus TaxID=1328070 RepID=A0A8C9AH17_PROSS